MNKYSNFSSLLLWFFLFMVLFSGGQRAFAQVDTTYIKPFPFQYTARVYAGQNQLSLVFENERKDEVYYMPNSPINLGFGFSWKNSSLSLGYGISSTREKGKGKTKIFDLQYHHYGENWVIDLYALSNKGFYEEENNQIQLYPNLKLSLYGAFVQYVFSGEKFSFSAAFDQNQQQIKSAGSWLIGGDVFYTTHKELPMLVNQFYAGDKRNLQLGPNIGYAYSWVFLPNFYFAASVSMGVNLGFEKERGVEGYNFLLNPMLFGRFSVGYNAADWSVNLSALHTSVYVKYKEDYQTSLETNSFKLTFIKRFDLKREISFLRKDIPLFSKK